MLNLVRSVYLHTVYRLFGPVIDRIILYNCFHSISIIFTYITENRKYEAIQKVKRGFEDHRSEVILGGTEYERVFERIARAFNKAKEDQKKVSQPPYLIGVQWQRTLDNQYGELITALQNCDTEGMKAIFENFARKQMSASQGGGVDYFQIKKQLLYKYLFVNTWYKYYNMCQEVTGKPPVVTYPMVCNPAGLYEDGKVIPIEAIRFHYCATQMLLLLEDISHPVICEIGGGNGGEIYAVISTSERPMTYIDLDIPEMLAIATYFLMVAFPEKHFLLYGEEEVDSNNLKNYDIAMVPHFKMPKLGDETVDLFFNQRSFGEMDSKTVVEYIHQIGRICRGYLMHINHSKKFRFDENGEKSENMPCTEIIPDPAKFKKVFEYPWMFNRFEEETIYRGTGNIAFLYERRKA